LSGSNFLYRSIISVTKIARLEAKALGLFVVMSNSAVSRTDILRRAIEGDAHAATLLVEEYRARLRRMVAVRLDKRIAARVDPSDVVQEALNRAYSKLPKYLAAPRISLYPWLRRITTDRLRQVHRDHIKTEKRSVLREHAWVPNFNDDSIADLAGKLVLPTVSPSRRIAQAEIEAGVNAALLRMKPTDREILVMRYLENMSVAEIAEELDVSQTVVTSRQLRALQRLRRQLGSKFVE
jgi:RNA polymerase sigma-70 factor (ECF subfamily)